MNEVRNSVIINALFVLLILTCSTFIREEQQRELLQLEGKTAIMKKTFEREGNRLEKGMKVRLHILTKDDSIRIYAYPSEVEFLKSKRILILHLFDDDFKDSKFDKAFFMDKLQEVVALEN